MRTPASNAGVHVFAPVMAATDKVRLSSREASNKNAVPYQKALVYLIQLLLFVFHRSAFQIRLYKPLMSSLNLFVTTAKWRETWTQSLPKPVTGWHLSPISSLSSGEQLKIIYSLIVRHFTHSQCEALHLSASHHKTTVKDRADSLCNWKSP